MYFSETQDAQISNFQEDQKSSSSVKKQKSLSRKSTLMDKRNKDANKLKKDESN